MSSRSKLVKNMVWNTTYQVLSLLIPLLTIPYVSRVLGTDGVGVYSYTYSIANYFVLFATLGMAQYGVREIAKCGNNRERRSKVFCSAWAAQVLVSLPIVCVYIVYIIAFSNRDYIVSSFLWLFWVASSSLDISWLYFGVEEFAVPTVRSVITKLVGTCIIFVFCRTSDDLWAYVLGISLPFFLNALMLFPFLNRYVDFISCPWAEIKRHFVPNLRLFAPVIAISLYSSFDKILLGLVSGMNEAGLFEYSDKVARMPLAVVTALGTVMLPHMTESMSCSSNGKESESLLQSSFEIMQFISLGLAFGIVAVAKPIADIYFGPGFEKCFIVLPIVAIMIPIIAASNVLGVQYMLPKNMDKQYTKSVVFGAIANILLCCLLLKPYGSIGAGIATVLTELTVLFVQGCYVKKQLNLCRMVVCALPYVIIGLLMLFLVAIISPVFITYLGYSWVYLFSLILFGAFIYLSFSVLYYKTVRFLVIGDVREQ